MLWLFNLGISCTVFVLICAVKVLNCFVMCGCICVCVCGLCNVCVCSCGEGEFNLICVCWCVYVRVL